MANTFLTTDEIVVNAALVLSEQLKLTYLANHEYESYFQSGRKGGDSIRVTIPTLSDGYTTTARTPNASTVRDITQTSVNVTLSELIYDKFAIPRDQALLDIESARREVIEPSMAGIVKKLERFAARKAARFAQNFVGTPGNDIESLEDYTSATKLIYDNSGYEEELWGTVTSASYKAMLDLNQFQDVSYGAEKPLAFKRGLVDKAENVNTVRVKTLGTFDRGDIAGTVLVNGTTQTGSTLAVDGFTAATGTVYEGTRFTIDGIAGTTFIVTDDATLASNSTTLSIYPALPSSPSDDAAITFLAAHKENYIYNPDAFSLLTVPVLPGENVTSATIPAGMFGAGLGISLVTGDVSLTDLSQQWMFCLYVGGKVIQPMMGCCVNGA
jgi:hypothetical protein